MVKLISLGGAIERWEDLSFRKCFSEIFAGNWRDHDAYDLARRVDAKSSLYGRAGQVSKACLEANLRTDDEVT